MDLYNYNTLMNLLGDQVDVSDSGGNRVTLTVMDVLNNGMNSESWESFSVIYKGNSTFRIPQGNYTFEHRQFGKKSVFLSPKNETEYESVVTRNKVNN